ncbi:MAG: hypothetical protein AB8B79_22325 [Granulosicoccus sp.]
MTIKIFYSVSVLIFALFVSACSIVTVETYVHDDTAHILNTFYWTHDKRTLEDVIEPDMEGLILVPDFKRAGSGTLTLRAIATKSTSIYIDRFVLSAEQTDEVSSRKLGQAPVAKESKQGIWVATVRINNVANGDTFAQASKIVLTVYWSDGEHEEYNESTFELIRKRTKDIAWVT